MHAAGRLLSRPLHVAHWKGPTRFTLSKSSFSSTLVRRELPPRTASATTQLVRHTHPSDPLTFYNKQLEAITSGPSFGSAHTLDQVLRVCQQIKEKKLRPDLTTYNALLATYEKFEMVKDALNTLEEMEMIGIIPNIVSYNSLLKVCAHDDASTQYRLLEKMRASGTIPTAISYECLIKSMCNNIQLERALDTLHDVRQQGFQPTLPTYDALLRVCIDCRESEMAFKLLKEAEMEHMGVAGFPRIYLEVMRVCAEDGLHNHVCYCWTKIFREHHFRPDQGLCLLILGVAGNHGDSKLASEVIQHIGDHGYHFSEPHFAPLLQAFAVKGDLKNAFAILDIMRTYGIEPEKETAFPIYHAIRGDISAIDNAYYALEELRGENKTVDVVALNVIIHACAMAGDLNRAIATYRESATLGVTPDVDTYNAVLEACIIAKKRDLGDVVVKEMKAAGISPNVATYAKMIALSCTQTVYDDAFKFLEEMKGYGIVPPEGTYIGLIKRLAKERDPRVHVALEEMELFGYKVEEGLREYVSTGGLTVYYAPEVGDGYGGAMVDIKESPRSQMRKENGNEEWRMTGQQRRVRGEERRIDTRDGQEVGQERRVANQTGWDVVGQYRERRFSGQPFVRAPHTGKT